MKIIQRHIFIIFFIKVIISEQKIIKNMMDLYNIIPYTNDALMHILGTCRKNYNTLLISVDQNETNLKWLHNFHTNFSIILKKNATKYTKNINHMKKIDAHILFMQYISNLEKILINSHRFLWWDVMIPVYILNNRCNNYEVALRLMWKYESLTAYFLCFDSHQKVKIYTYNPFTSQALSEWERCRATKNYQSWTLYEQTYYENDDNICNKLDFDRTKFLDGFEIIVAVSRSGQLSQVGFYNNSFLAENKTHIGSISAKFLDVFVKAMNVTLKIYLFPQRYQSLDMKHLKSIRKFRHDIYRNSSADMIFVYQYFSRQNTKPHSRLKYSYPIIYSEMGILTYNRGYRTPIEKIYDFYGKWTLLFTIFILLITFIVIWYNEHKKFAFALMDITRLLINHSLHTPMNNLSLRIFFFFIFIYFLIIQATFNGHLAKFLTAPDLRDHPESLEDIKRLGYKPYYYLSETEQFLIKINKQKKMSDTNSSIHKLSSRNFILEELMENSSAGFVKKFITYTLNNNDLAACIINYATLQKYAIKNNKLHVSKKPFGFSNGHFLIRKKWPLTNRVNKFIQQLLELGISKHWHHKKIDYYSRIDRTVQAKINKNYQPVRLDNLSFFFIILGIGLISAIIIFCIEIYVKNRT